MRLGKSLLLAMPLGFPQANRENHLGSEDGVETRESKMALYDSLRTSWRHSGVGASLWRSCDEECLIPACV
jgi:hypothetical protein